MSKTDQSIPGYQKLLDDIALVRAKFASPEFKGKFDMGDWGRATPKDGKPPSDSYCGTVACLAGWFAILGTNLRSEWNYSRSLNRWILSGKDQSFMRQAEEVYDLSPRRVIALFISGQDQLLSQKLEQAEQMALAMKGGDLDYNAELD